MDNLVSGLAGALLATIASIGYSSYKEKKTKVESQIKALVLIQNELTVLWKRFNDSYVEALEGHVSGDVLPPFQAGRDYFTAFENYSHDLGLLKDTNVIASIFTIYTHMKGFLDTSEQFRHLFSLNEETSNLIASTVNPAVSLSTKQQIYFKGLLECSDTIVDEYRSLVPAYEKAISNIEEELLKLNNHYCMFL